MSGDFDKSEGEINPILNALKGAQGTRQSTEERLKKELQEELENKVAAYIDTLGLGEKIAAEAIKGGYSITVLWLAKVAGTRKRGMQKVELGRAMSGFWIKSRQHRTSKG